MLGTELTANAPPQLPPPKPGCVGWFATQTPTLGLLSPPPGNTGLSGFQGLALEEDIIDQSQTSFPGHPHTLTSQKWPGNNSGSHAHIRVLTGQQKPCDCITAQLLLHCLQSQHYCPRSFLCTYLLPLRLVLGLVCRGQAGSGCQGLCLAEPKN